MSHPVPRTLIFLVTEDWYFVSHRLPLARAAVAEGYRVVVATRIGNHGDTLRHAGCEIAPLSWSRGAGHLLGDIRLLFRMLALYRRERPTVVHHVALKPVIYGSLIARLVGVPVTVNAIAGLGFVFTNQTALARGLRPLIRTALRLLLGQRGAWTILQNPDDRALLCAELGLQPDRAVLIRGAGVDLEEFPAAPEPEGAVVIALVARMLWDKGVGEFVAAARQLRRDGCTARFVLVGGVDPDNPRAIPEAVLDEWVTEGVVEWWGHRTPMAAVYASVHVVVLPSYREGLPKCLLEAAASGRPVITTDVPGCREAVRDGESGMLVPVRQVAPLASAIRQLIDRADLRTRMGAAGRRMMEDEFSVDDVVRRTLRLYRTAPEQVGSTSGDDGPGV